MLCSTVHGHRQPGRSLSKGFLVEVVHSMAGANPLEVGDVVSQLLDARHLLVQEVALDEVCHLWEIKGGGEGRKNQLTKTQIKAISYEKIRVYEKVTELERGMSRLDLRGSHRACRQPCAGPEVPG